MIVTLSFIDCKSTSLPEMGFKLACMDLVESDGLCLLKKEY